jgi:hypothetical protein
MKSSLKGAQLAGTIWDTNKKNEKSKTAIFLSLREQEFQWHRKNITLSQIIPD